MSKAAISGKKTGLLSLSIPVLQSLERHRRMNSTPDEDLICTGGQSRVERSYQMRATRPCGDEWDVETPGFLCGKYVAIFFEGTD